MSTWAVMLQYQREALAARCLEALLQSRPVAPTVLLVDACSPDGSGARLHRRFPQVEYLGLTENLGYAGGNNAGIEYALARGATKVLVLNDDAEVLPETLALLEEALDADPGASAAAPTIYFGAVGGPICWAGGELDRLRALGTAQPRKRAGRASCPPPSSPSVFLPPPPLPPPPRSSPPHPSSFLSGCCMLLRATALHSAGAFDASYWSYGEDVELSLRHTKAGWRLLWVPAAQAVHHTAYPEPEAPAWKIRLRDRNRRRMVRAHYSAMERWAFALWFYPTRLLRGLGYALRGDWARLAAIWRGATER